METKTEVKKQIDKEFMLAFWREAAELGSEDLLASKKSKNPIEMEVAKFEFDMAHEMITLIESGLFDVDVKE